MLETQKGNPPAIKQIIASDLRKYSEEMGLTLREVIKEISSNSNITERTLRRIMQEDALVVPHVRTVVDIYSHLYKSTSLAEIISKAPFEISEYIRENHTQCIMGDFKVSEISQHPSFQSALTESDIFNQIYILSGGNYGTVLEKIREQFGLNGLKQLDEMLKHGFVEVDSEERILRKGTLTWDRKIRQNLASTVINEVYDQEHANDVNPNYLGMSLGDVTPNDYNQIRKIMKEASDKALKIINESNPTYEEAIRIVSLGLVEKVDFKSEGGI